MCNKYSQQVELYLPRPELPNYFAQFFVTFVCLLWKCQSNYVDYIMWQKWIVSVQYTQKEVGEGQRMVVGRGKGVSSPWHFSTHTPPPPLSRSRKALTKHKQLNSITPLVSSKCKVCNFFCDVCCYNSCSLEDQTNI